jgi:ActR/RegA family two-component response regulator
MAKSLLLVTADVNFGQVLLYGLEQAGYAAFIVKGKGESVVRADEKDCTLALLDMDLGYKAVLDIARGLRALRPHMDLVLLSDE